MAQIVCKNLAVGYGNTVVKSNINFYVENNNGAMSKMIKNPSLDIIIATERLLQVIAQRKDLKPECCYVTVSHLFQYVIGLCLLYTSDAADD